jgi:hypothetical protein
MRMTMWSAAASLLLLGCSALLDTGKQQCTQAEQCGLFENRPTYECREHFCEKVSCSADAECANRGPFVCEDSSCAPAECLRDEECGDGQACADGRCIDPVFHCFGKKQPLTSKDPPVVQLTLLSYGDQRAVRNLEVRVCAIADLACNTPISVDTSYDESGVLSIRGLKNGSRYSIRMNGQDSNGTELMEAEYYMLRPVVGLTVEADKLEMVPPELVYILAASASTTFHPNMGLVLAQTFGCDNKPLAGISLSDNHMANLFYMTGVTSTSATETDGEGVGGFVNMEVDNAGNALQHRLTFSYAGKSLFSFTAPPRPNVLTFLAVYMGDYGTTSDRSSAAPR